MNKNINLPNTISLLRLLLAPALIGMAAKQHPAWFIATVLFSGFTDVLDGFLARKLNQITRLGSHLDSWGDFATYTAMAIGAWLLWPNIVRREILYFVLIIASFTLPVVVGLIKFQTLTSYHTWSVKISVFISFIAYVLLFGEMITWPFRAAAIFCVIAAIEEIAITLLMDREHIDVRSFRKALKHHRRAV